MGPAAGEQVPAAGCLRGEPAHELKEIRKLPISSIAHGFSSSATSIARRGDRSGISSERRG